MQYHRRRRLTRRITTPLIVLAGAALVGALVGVAPVMRTSVAYGEPIIGCSATDVDTIRCGRERIRLLAIDAPELPGHCRQGRACAPGDPYASTLSLADVMAGQLTIKRIGEDHYGRTLALVAGGKGDLSCWQISQGHAVYKAAWDNGFRVARTCPTAALP